MLELIGEVFFRRLDDMIKALSAWQQLENVQVEVIRGVVRLYKVVRP